MIDRILNWWYNLVLPQSFEGIVRDIKSKHTHEELLAIQADPREHMYFTCWIRNRYRLWSDDHPLTSFWHAHPEQRDIHGGIDFSYFHPDNVSEELFQAALAQ
jgi:hypothetical protein